MHPYERIQAWRLAHRLFLAVHHETASWPKREWYGLTAQIRRSSFSVAANIVEGAAKRGSTEYCRYLDISLGSLAETQYMWRVARDLGYVPPGSWAHVEGLSREAGKCLWGLARAVARLEG